MRKPKLPVEHLFGVKVLLVNTFEIKPLSENMTSFMNDPLS